MNKKSHHKACNGFRNENAWRTYIHIKNISPLYYKAASLKRCYPKDKAIDKMMVFLSEVKQTKTPEGIPLTKTNVSIAMGKLFVNK